MRYMTDDEINFSIIHPRTSYYTDGSILSQRMLDKMRWQQGQSAILIDEQGKERYFAKKVRYRYSHEDYKTTKDIYIRRHYAQLISHPPMTNHIIWPFDMVLLSKSTRDKVSLLVANNYQVFLEDVKNDVSSYALLFSCGHDAVISQIKCSLSKYLSDIRNQMGPLSCNYTNEIIRLLAYSIVCLIYEMNRSGYQYYDIDMSRFFLGNDGCVVLDFSNMIYTNAEMLMINEGRYCIEEPNEIPLTYAEPALFQSRIQLQQDNPNKILMPDFSAQNYSLAAFLFQLYFDIHPYNGCLYETFDESSKMKRYNKCEAYLNNPIFIFDRKNKKNYIEEDRYQTKLWYECPKILRKIFLSIFDMDNSTRRNGKYNYPTPTEWLHLLASLGWK